ncbi:winged helix-turn-helix transcriptional regulator [Streptomyces sp. 6N223]|uniref:winged helix-turn-helix transcriptional regulator n=1 Tax=Streptomyces sp. 6N223 TaxID=3457412 RepID=UPI003FCFDB33
MAGETADTEADTTADTGPTTAHTACTKTGIGACTEPESALLRVFELLGKRWTGVVVASLISGPGHFAELKRAIPGISERMLSDRLSELAELGLLTREVEPGPPLRVNYELTESGHGLRDSLTELTRWAERYLPEEGKHCPSEFRD